MSWISEASLETEKHVAEQSLATTGHLPEGNQSGARFWSLVRDHYVRAVDTGHVAWFDANHCAFVDHIEAEFPVNQPIPPNIPMPIAGFSVIPPARPLSLPGVPVSPGYPPFVSVGPSGAVPEPISAALLGIGLILAIIGGRLVSKRDQ